MGMCDFEVQVDLNLAEICELSWGLNQFVNFIEPIEPLMQVPLQCSMRLAYAGMHVDIARCMGFTRIPR